jgi:carboxymethylenebutenolidase
MSGPYALAAAARYPDRIAAAASFYGTWLVSEAEESPHLSLGKVKGELYIACAEHDKLAPLPMVDELRTLFARLGPRGKSNCIPASTTVSPSCNGGVTTGRLQKDIGSG